MGSDDWYRVDDLGVFLSRAGDFLRSRPALHTLPLTVTEQLRTRGAGVYGDEAPYFGVLERQGTVRAVYFRTPPHRLNVTSLTPEEAGALAGHLAADGRPLPGVSGERASVAALARAWERRTGARAAVRQRQRLYRLDALTAPGPVPKGRARVAGEADRQQLVRWYGEFMAAVGESAGQRAEGWADTRISYGGVTFWEDADGTPLAMAGATPMVAGQVRVAPVYTPAELRGRGYAGAVTVEVSRAARASGADEVLLFTDLANPTSNALYQRIGYRPVADFDLYDFDGHDVTG
ncbi:GNAT family N-acetyltransferase [Streptomyces griseorubiginosus]|uniref:GNAT family N-acetyltransferase n=1 Tax=Streptomyces griseorubiginosus TaxID=67304 RepID=UPI001AD6848E|nr:GNAT family N-acetyltransferase [Streptomyces griseorubiginosus]MBO4256898.1 GNAT family N-acetyltransferase [Streptomyces griseorubiginosus]